MKTCVTIAFAVAACGVASLDAHGQAPVSRETWGFVTSIVGSNVTLDDGSLVRLNAGTRVTRPDGSAGTRDDISRQGKVIVTYATDGTVTSLRVFRPRSEQEIYLSNVPPARGAVVVTPVALGGQTRARSLALLRASYARQWNWLAFRAQVRYDPRGTAGAPTAARFALKNGFGDPIVERVVPAGQTADLQVGLDAQAGDRMTLEVVPADTGVVQQEWCLWLDPHFVIPATPNPAALLSPRTAEKLVEALTKSAGTTKVERLSVADFGVVKVQGDQFLAREFTDQLFTLLGRRYTVANMLRRPLDVGTPLTDADRAELTKLGAAFVLAGRISGRVDGTVVTAVIVQVDNGAFVASALVRD